MARGARGVVHWARVRIRSRIRRFRRWRTFRRSSAVIVSYPKCGRTWLRLLVGEAIDRHFGLDAPLSERLELTPLADRGQGVPRLDVTHDRESQTKTPEQLDPSKARYRRTKVVLLARDPRDAIVSLYFQVAKRPGYHDAYDRSFSEFLRERRGSMATLIAFYNQWAAQRDVPKAMMLVRYEELHADTAGELRRVLDFIGLDGVSDTVIADAVAACSFEQMRALELADAAESNRLRAGTTGDEASLKTREGRVGGHRRHVTPDDDALLESAVAELDPWYGYGIM